MFAIFGLVKSWLVRFWGLVWGGLVTAGAWLRCALSATRARLWSAVALVGRVSGLRRSSALSLSKDKPTKAASPDRFRLRPIRLVRDNTSITFVKWRRISIYGALAASVLSLTMFFVWPGLNYGIDFDGGILIEARTEQTDVDLGALRRSLEDLNRGQVTVQNLNNLVSDSDTQRQFLVRIQRQETEEAQQEVIDLVRATLMQSLPDLDVQRTEAVGGAVSGELVQGGLLAVGLGLLAMLFYIWFRFEWDFGLGVLLSLLGEVCIILGFFAVTQLPFTLASVAAVLALIGYSINDKVVIYDRIRENFRLYKRPVPPDEVPDDQKRTIINDYKQTIIDRSLNSTLNRTLGTSLSTIVAVMPLAIFGTQSLLGFTLPLLFGVALSTTSSLMVAAPLLLWIEIIVNFVWKWIGKPITDTIKTICWFLWEWVIKLPLKGVRGVANLFSRR